MGKTLPLSSGCLAAVLVAGSMLGSAADCSASGQPLSVGSSRQLFVDDRLVDPSQTHDVTRTLNPPTEIRRVLVPDQPWETLGFIFYSSVVDAGDELKLFYGSYSYDQKMERHFCLATSQDGLNWTRPKLGVSTFEGSAENNLVSSGAFDGAVFIDPVAPSEKRYRLLASGGMATPETGGLFVESSPDGIRWTKPPAHSCLSCPTVSMRRFMTRSSRSMARFSEPGVSSRCGHVR